MTLTSVVESLYIGSGKVTFGAALCDRVLEVGRNRVQVAKICVAWSFAGEAFAK